MSKMKKKNTENYGAEITIIYFFWCFLIFCAGSCGFWLLLNMLYHVLPELQDMLQWILPGSSYIPQLGSCVWPQSRTRRV